jgi:DNA ligase 1
MRHFSVLISRLDQSNKTSDKLDALMDFFRLADDHDKVWAIAIFSHRRPKRQVSTRQLREWCAETTGIPDWLFEESYHSVGDLAETIALLLPPSTLKSEKNLSEWIDFLNNLEFLAENEKKTAIMQAWNELDQTGRFVFNKIITGGFRIGVSQNLLTRALSKVLNLDKSQVAHALMGNWDPRQINFADLFDQNELTQDLSKPYPFFLAHPLESLPEELGQVSEWQAEWKWDGIRGQLIRRKGEIFLWSRGEELINEKFPELAGLAEILPDGTVIDGEIMAYREGKPLPFSLLQTRISRKNVSKKQLLEAPAAFLAYDMLEYQGEDIRNNPLKSRRQLLENLLREFPHPSLHISPSLEKSTWNELIEIRNQSRENLAEGLMLKRLDSPYETGRKRGSWWKWKIEPLTIDGVMIYAQKGHGRRADLYSDYTFGVWDGDTLVPFAKAYSGLTDAEMREVDAFVKKNTRERFGPVRTVKAELVFEIAFEGIQDSPRHKSGIALRFPRILRWRKDKLKEEANTLKDLKALFTTYGG